MDVVITVAFFLNSALWDGCENNVVLLQSPAIMMQLLGSQ